MRKITLSPLLILIMSVSMLLTGCLGQTANEYAARQITNLKENKADSFSFLLEQGIEETQEINKYALTFPNELKESYLAFLQNAFSCVDFEIASAKRKDNGTYSVQISFKPLNMARTTNSANTSYTASMQGTNLTEEVKAVLTENEEALKESPVYDERVTVEIEVKKDGDTCTVSDETMEGLITASIGSDYMAPYNEVCGLLDARDFLQAFLDASFKGEFAQFMKHTDRTEAEAKAWYEAGANFEPPADLAAQYKARCTAAYKNILRQCKYSVGIPKKENNQFNYTVEVAVTPNNSILDAYSKLIAGSYHSIEEASATYVETLEKYAATPAYGKETIQTIALNKPSLLAAEEGSGDLYTLAKTILPVP